MSGGVEHGPYTATIPSTPLTSPPNLLTGKVSYQDASLGFECLVSMRVSNKEPTGPGSADAHSLWVTGLTNGGGFTSAEQPFAYDPSSATSEITVVARCDNENSGRAAKLTIDAGFTGAGYENPTSRCLASPLSM